MAFPTIPTVAAGRVLTAVQADTTATRTFPNLSSLTKSAGDLLIAICVAYEYASTDAAFSSWGGGFTEFTDQGPINAAGIGCAYKWSTGSETGTFTVTQATTVVGHAAMILLSIPGAHGTTAPEAGARANGTSAAADPVSFDPTGWDAEDTLWIAIAGSGETGTGGAFTGVASAPASYSDYVDTGISADVVGGCEGAVAFRQLNAASENVGTFSVDLSNARNVALLVAVRPTLVYEKQNIAISPFTGGGTAQKIAGVYTKQNIAITPFVGAGADASTLAKAEIGISAFVGSGADAFTSSETGTGAISGTGVFPRYMSSSVRTGNVTADTGNWVLDYPTGINAGDLLIFAIGSDGSYALPSVSGWSVTTGAAQGNSAMLVIGKRMADGTESGTFTVTLPSSSEQGCWRTFRVTRWNAVSVGVGFSTGSDVPASGQAQGSDTTPDPPSLNPTDWDVETVLWMVFSTADGGDVTFTGFPSGYTDTSSQNSGGANGGNLGFAVKESAIANENPATFTISSSVGWGAKTVGVRPGRGGFIATGTSEKVGGAQTYEKVGSGISPFTGTADGQWTVVKTGLGATGKLASVKYGSGVSAFVGSGADASTLDRSGAGTSPFVGSGTDAVTFARTGVGVSTFAASGADAITHAETGAGISAFVASGTRAREIPRTGAGISAFVASGADAVESVETGAGIAPFVASGPKEVVSGGTTYEKVGTAIAAFVAAGENAITFVEAGVGTSVFTGSEEDAITFVETGAGTSAFAGTADGQWTLDRMGAGISAFTVAGDGQQSQANDGIGISPFVATGEDAVTSVESGAGVSVFAGSGADAITFVETGIGVIPFVASGTSAIEGATYIKVGLGVIGP